MTPPVPASLPATVEMELLLLCAQPVHDDARDARIEALLATEPDWNTLHAEADSHRLLPLLYWEMNARRPEALPETVAAAFRDNLKNSLLLTRELVNLIDLLDSEGIRAIPFKGPTLALRAYRNLALRNFCDLDILIRREDVWRARDLLLGHGFSEKLNLQQGREEAYLNSYDEVVMYGPDGSLLVELHWAFVPAQFSFPLALHDCWDRCDRLPIANRTLPSLDPDHLLFVLCVHGSKHCWSHLGLICDVAWLLTSYPFEWGALLRSATTAGIRRMLLLACALASLLLRAPLADPVQDAIEDDEAVMPLANEIAAALFGQRHDESSIRANGALHMRMRERLRDRIRYFCRLALRPGVEDWELIDLPGPLSFLYSVLRFPRLAMKYRSRLS